MNNRIRQILITYAFFTAVATTIYAIESLAVRALPLPFLRIGLANAVVLYILWQHDYVMALFVTIAKTIIGGTLSFTLLSPATVLSLLGGAGAYVIMWLLLISRMQFSIIGISIAGAVLHNIIQTLGVRWFIIPRDAIYNLLPLLMLIGIVTGLITGIAAFELTRHLRMKTLAETPD